MGICDSTMGLKSTLFVTALLLSGAVAAVKTQAYFNETAYLPCQFINSQNRSLDELVVFWQNQEKLVVYELYQGKEKYDNVDSKYKSRHISFDEENWTLQLHNVEIKDQGDYQCFIHHKSHKGLVPIHKMSSELSVIANFSQPEILEDSNTSSKSYRNLTCYSVQGYPHPEEMYFLLRTENSTTKYSPTMQKSQDNITELYKVSISWSYSGFHDPSNRSVTCVLCVLGMCLFSKPYNIVPPKTHLPPKDNMLWIAAPSLVIVGVMVFFLAQWKRKKKQPDLSRERHESETIKMEGEESKNATHQQVPTLQHC
ncbi:T-lymphocyte activation antigen CD86 isoform 1-T1 [Trichechus inunguis]